MVLAYVFLGCSSIDKTTDVEETTDLDSADTGSQDTETPSDITLPDDAIRPFCRTQTYKSSSNGEVLTDITYTWEGNTQTAPEWQGEYNNYGYLTKSLSTMNEYISNSILTYECDGWCRLQTSYYESGESAENLDVSEIEYRWEGNTQYQDARYWVYNDYGYVVEQYDEGSGFNSTITNEYECDEHWCKLQRATTVLQSTNGDTETVVDYTWEGNRQTSETGYTLYNEYGYVLEQEYSSATFNSFMEFSYLCD